MATLLYERLKNGLSGKWEIAASDVDPAFAIAFAALAGSVVSSMAIWTVANQKWAMAVAGLVVTAVVLGKYAMEMINNSVYWYYKRTLAEDRDTARAIELEHHHLDLYTKMMLTVIRKGNLEHNADAPKAHQIREPTVRDAHAEVIFPMVALATVDEDNEMPLSKKMIAKIVDEVQMENFNNTDEPWVSVDVAVAFSKKYLGDVMPPVNVKYDELCSDEAMSRLAFSGVCCGYTRGISEDSHAGGRVPSGAAFVCDLSALSTYPVKDGYERYGAIAYFGAKYGVVGIYWCHAERVVSPQDKDWEHAKYVWRTTIIAQCTLKDHLYETHMIESNLLTVASYDELPPTHFLRHFLKPFTFRAVTVNTNAKATLTSERGLIHRIWAFDYAQVLKIFTNLAKNYKFRTIPERMHPSMENVDDSVFGFRADAMAFWRLMRKYVASFFDIYFADTEAILRDRAINAFADRLSKGLKLQPFECNNGADAERFIDVVTQLLCSVTGIHEHVGQASDYVTSPEWVGARLRPDSNMCSVQEYALLCALVCLTGMKAPKLMGDWSHLIPKDEHYERVLALYNEWGADLIAASDGVRRRNKARKYQIEAFDPRVMECSVSV